MILRDVVLIVRRRIHRTCMPVLFGIILLYSLGNTLHAQVAVPLDSGILSAARDIENYLEEGSKVLVLNFNSPTVRFSKYVLEDLREILLKGRKLTVVDRENLNDIREEWGLQMSGDVSDESQVAIGKMLGAQSIVSGSIEDYRSYYRIRFRTISVVTAAIEVQSSFNIRKDRHITNLMTEQVEHYNVSPWAYGAMNLAFGLGSYLQGDTPAGILITVGYTIAVSLIIWEAAGLKYDDPLAGVPGPIGIGLAGVTTVFGFVKPHFNRENARLAFFMDGLAVRPVAVGKDVQALGITYILRF